MDSPYARWSLGPPTDPSWFPIGVWLQAPHLAERYARLGVNTYVGLWQGPTEEQLAALAAAGMKVVCAMNPVGLAHLEDPTIVAWMQEDEPDNKAKDRPGPRATPEEIRARYERMRTRDPRRPVWLNLGQGVANDEWKGRGASPADYPGYAAGADVLSFDVYPVTNLRRADGGELLWYVAKGVRRLRAWSEDRAVVWNFLECTRGAQTEWKPTPEQIRAEAWLGLVAGSRGIVWFCHEFLPEGTRSAALLEDPEAARAVREVNEEVLRWAPVLNAPDAAGRASVESPPETPVGLLAKDAPEGLTLLAVGMRNAPCEATFRVPGLGDGRVEVVEEGRELTASGDAFRDAFGPFEVHRYRVLG